MKKTDKTDKDAFTTPQETQTRVIKKRAINKGKQKVEKLTKALDQLKIKYVSLDKLKPNEYNPNRQSEDEFELLCRSMEEDGFTQPIIATMDGTIVDGEHRWRAAHALKMKDIPVVFVDYTEAQRKIATLRHNRARGSEDVELSTDVLRDLEKLGALDWAMDSLMMTEDEIQRLIDDIPAPEDYGKEHEYTEAWVPVSSDQSTDEVSDDLEAHSTDSAKRTAFLRQDALGKAKSEEEIELAKRMQKTHSITFNFTMDEYVVVKKALGDNPARRIVEWSTKNA